MFIKTELISIKTEKKEFKMQTLTMRPSQMEL